MTVARGKLLERLATNGRPQMWADEGEAAVLSGLSPERFRLAIKDLELRGFPKVNPMNGKRSIPAILAFWKLPVNDDGQRGSESRDERAVENW